MTIEILIVEDNQKIAKIIKDYMEKENFQTHKLMDGNDVVSFVKDNKPDIIILDIMLPNKDGISICKEIRRFSNTPIIFLTARVEEIDRVIGLEIGADDYVCKPFSPRELVARVKVQLRRDLNQLNHTNTLTNSQIKLIKKQLLVTIGDESIELTLVEFNIIKLLYDQEGRIFNRNQIMTAAYSDERFVNDRAIDNHIKKIRKKLKLIDSKQEYIHSVYGCGYKFEMNDA
jgi:two-component system response regulator BaeR